MTIRSDDASNILETSSQVIDAVGGTTAAAQLADSSPQSVNNWRRSGRLAGDTFLIFSEELKERGLRAPLALWGMKPSRTVHFAGR